MNLIIDGNNLAFCSNMTAKLSTDDGFPTQAIYGFMMALGAVAAQFKPKRILVAWDGGKSELRLKVMPDYKAYRVKDPGVIDEMKAQTPVIEKILGHLGAIQLRGPGVEADDIIGILATHFDEINEPAVIFSSDSDCYQLISRNVSLYSVLSSVKVRHLTCDNFKEAKGLTPEQWLDYKALVGDKSDGIPGVKGVGEGTAMKVLQQFGSVDNFFLEVVGKRAYTPDRYEKKIIDGIKDFRHAKWMIDLRHPLTEALPKIVQTNGARDDVALRMEFDKYQVNNFDRWIRQFDHEV